MSFDGRREPGIDCPTDLGLREAVTQHAENGQRLNNVAQGAEAHQQDLIWLCRVQRGYAVP